MTNVLTQPVPGSRVRLPNGDVTLVVDPARFTTGTDERPCSLDASSTSFLAERPDGWNATEIGTGRKAKLWWYGNASAVEVVEEPTAVEVVEEPPAVETVEHFGRTLPADSLLGRAALLLPSLTDDAATVIGEVINACVIADDDRTCLQGAFDDRNATLTRLRSEFDAFRTQVRDLIIEKAESGSICRDGANRALERLDLPGMERRFEVVMRLSQYVTVEVEAVDEDEAREKAEEENDTDDLLSAADSYSWDVEVDEVRRG